MKSYRGISFTSEKGRVLGKGRGQVRERYDLRIYLRFINTVMYPVPGIWDPGTVDSLGFFLVTESQPV